MATNNSMEINGNSTIKANPGISLREEPDRWGLLYHKGNNFTMGITPETVFIWKQIESQNTVKDIAARVKKRLTRVSTDIEKEIIQLVRNLSKKDFISVIPAPGGES